MNNQYPPTVNRKIAPWGLGKRGSLIPKAQNSTTQHYPMASPRKARNVVIKQMISNSWLAHFLPSEQYAQNAQCLHLPKSKDGPDAEFELSNESKFVSKGQNNLCISVAFSFTLLHPCRINPLQEGQDHREPWVWPQDHSEMFERPVFVFVPCTSPAPFYHMLSLLGRRLLTGCGLWLCSLRIQICPVVCWVCRVRCTETGPEAVPSRRPMVPVLFIIAQVSSSHQFVSLLSKFLGSGGNFNPSNQHPV